MIPQEPNVALLVDYLYDLLDPPARQQVEELLRASEGWRTALAAAKREQQILAEAAKSDFSSVTFDPPKTTTNEPITTSKATKRSTWLRWAVAACLGFLVVGGLASGGRWFYLQNAVWSASTEVAQFETLAGQRENDYTASRTQTRQSLREIQEQLEGLVKKWSGELKNVEKSDGKIRVVVQGPQTLHAGATNTFQIITRPGVRGGPSGRNAKKLNLTAEVIDPQADDAVVFRNTMECALGTSVSVPLPHEQLRLEPGRDLYMRVTARDQEGNVETITEQLPIVGTTYMTHLTTDRPLYKPGETVHFRSMTLDRFGLQSPKGPLDVQVQIQGPGIAKPVLKQIKGTSHVTTQPSDEKARTKKSTLLKGPDGRVIYGICSGDWPIPTTASGGEYTITVSSPTQKFPTQVRTFLVQKYRSPRLNKELELNGKSYGPGDKVGLRAKASFTEGGKSFSGKTAVVKVTVDGNVWLQRTHITNAQGEIRFEFELPRTIIKGSGTVSVLFTDNKGVRETIVRPIPIVLNTLYVQFYPEGGDLVAGVPNRVYFEVTRPNGKPADLKGELFDGDENRVTIFDCNRKEGVKYIETLRDDDEAGVNQGMGVFTFVPKFGKRYHLKLVRPIGVRTKNHPRSREPYAVLPPVKNNGIVLAIEDGVVKDRIDLTLRNAGDEKTLMVGVYCRGREMARKEGVRIKAGRTLSLTLSPSAPIGGVYRVTVFEKVGDHYTERAERLIYRRPTRKLNFQVTPDKTTYAPGDPVSVTIQATDEQGRPAKAIVGVSVIDKSNLKLADDKTIRSMPTHFYLASEIKQPKDLEYADFLVGDTLKAEQALDLLLGTQGWRRFIEVNPRVTFQRNARRNPVVRFADDHLPVASARISKSRDAIVIRKQKVDVKHAPRVVEVLDKQTETEAIRQAKDSELQRELNLASVKVQQAQAAKAMAEEVFNDYTSWLLGIVLVTAIIVLFGVALVCGVIGLIKSDSKESGGEQVYLAICFISLAVAFITLYAITVVGTRSEATFHMVSNELVDGGDGGIEGAKEAPMAMAPARDEDRFFAVEEKARLKEMPAANVARPQDAKRLAPPQDPQRPAIRNGPQPEANRLVAPAPPEAPGQFGAAEADEPNFEGENFPLDAGPEPDRRIGINQVVRPGVPGGPRRFPMPPRGNVNQLRRQNQYQRLARVLLRENREIAGMPRPKRPFVAREYAYRNPRNTAETKTDERTSFLETLYWHPVKVLSDGQTKIAFDINDSVTTFEIKVFGHTLDGRLGSTTKEIASRLPFSISPLVPTELSNTDELVVPVTAFNDTKASQEVTITGEATGLNFVGSREQNLNVGGGQNQKVLFRLEPNITEGKASVLLRGSSKTLGGDAVRYEVGVVPEGFPFVGAKSDTLDRPVFHTIDLPERLVEGSLRCRVRVYPTVVAELQKGLDGLLREPYGCFEQTSSSNYPNVMILSYLKTTRKAAPEVEERARGFIKRGYKRLISFECTDPAEMDKRGYEWFGGTAPPHEALTAYGLLQFKDLSGVYDSVNAEMLKRTENYLLGQRDGRGSFKRNKRALDSFGSAPPHITDAYIVWSLTETGTKADLSKEFQALQARAKDSTDPYFLSLVSLGLLNNGKTKEVVELLKKVSGMQAENGQVEGAQTSITRSGGRDLQIETTSLALMAWLRVDDQLRTNGQDREFNQQSRAAAKWVGQQRGGFGGFGSTQSTILALKALIAYAKERTKTAKSGDLMILLKDNETGQFAPVAVEEFNAGHEGEIVAEIPSEQLKLFRPGKNEVQIRLTNNKLPYTLNWTYNTLRPNNPKAAPVHLTTRLDQAKARQGETVQLSLKVENKTGVGQGMTVAVIGLPAGLQLPPDRKELKELATRLDKGTKPGKIGAWEVSPTGRELILYWRSLAPNQKPIEIDLTLICKYPGKFRGPASRAYLYYTSEQKYWVDPLKIEIGAE